MSNTDYPRMLFHRSKEPVTVRSREEEDALGEGWSRTIWAAAPAKAPDPAPVPVPVPEPEPEPGGPADQIEALHRAVRARSNPEPEEEVSPDPRRPARPPLKPPAVKKAKTKR